MAKKKGRVDGEESDLREANDDGSTQAQDQKPNAQTTFDPRAFSIWSWR
jgi:hypothetical protein